MVKTIAFFRRKKGLSREEFSDHYEMTHVPLAMKNIPNMKGYVRNHVPTSFSSGELEFDCISEFWYETMDEFQKVIAYLQSDSSQVIHDDEETFMDRTKSVFFFVDEKTSETQDMASPREMNIENSLKMMVLAKRKPDISHEAYIQYFEGACIPVFLKNSYGLKGCVRNYAHSHPEHQDTRYHCIIEAWYENKEAFTEGMRMWGEEGSRTEHLNINVLRVNECVSIRTN